MTKPKSDCSFTHEVAKFYESTLVPLIFAPYAEDLAARAHALQPESILEVACGTGVVTRELANELPASCEITATDINDAMVDHGEQVGTSRDVHWQRADVMDLPFKDESFDVVVCQFGVMFFPDRVAAYREIRRVLRPGGKLLFSMWNEIERNEFAHVVTDAMGHLFPENPPVFLTRTPHGHGCAIEIESEIRKAGFHHCEFDQRDDVSSADSSAIAAVAYCHGTPLRNEIEDRQAGGLRQATDVAAQALVKRFGGGAIEGRISAVVVTAS